MTKATMINEELATRFLRKVDTEGLDYAAQNYAPENSGDRKFDKLIAAYQKAFDALDGYLADLRETYNIQIE
jgi:hypothetical protein